MVMMMQSFSVLASRTDSFVQLTESSPICGP
jgi:hypothetical protein